jgi:hypothetical protein
MSGLLPVAPGIVAADVRRLKLRFRGPNRSLLTSAATMLHTGLDCCDLCG